MDNRKAAWAVGVLLAVASCAVFGRSVFDWVEFGRMAFKQADVVWPKSYGFVNYDDDMYVTDNQAVQAGLSFKGVQWAFTQRHGGNWHPLTSLSHMLDCQLYGLWAGGHHLTNVLLHAATAVLLFLVLLRMTGRLWPAAFVAAMFALHPLRVESVVWISERKDVLSGLLFMLTLAAYARFADGPFRVGRYLLVMACLALGLMAKPILVTVPFLLLLLDYWPLGRLANGDKSYSKTIGRLLLEKVPLLVLSGLSCQATLWAQQRAIAENVNSLSVPWRIANALVAYAQYLGQTFWPANMALLYPHPETSLPMWKLAVAVALLAAISVAVLWWWRKRPYLLVGWGWYLGMLVPVIGLIQVGSQAMADRYTYLPQIGIWIAIAWTAADWAAHWAPARRLCWAAGLAAVLAAAIGSVVQTGYWRNSEALWTHTLACTSRNFYAHNNLGETIRESGRIEEALVHYQESVDINPNYVQGHSNLGSALRQTHHMKEALEHFQTALRIDPQFARARNNLANALAELGRTDEALFEYQRALETNPELTNAHTKATVHYNMGFILCQAGRIEEAIAHFQEALAIEPTLLAPRRKLADLWYRQGRVREAVDQWLLLVRLQPRDAVLLNQTAWILATCPDASIRNAAIAVDLAQRAVQLSGGHDPRFHDTLAAAYARAGRFPEAVQAARQALTLASAPSVAPLAENLRARLRLYEAGTAYQGP
jgi:tetratricopeptide (TPR) repeat protein